MTLEELRKQVESGEYQVEHGMIPVGSRFHKAICKVCGALVTNQAMGRKAHMDAHKRKGEAKAK